MNELIKLSPTEQFLANQNITMTLHELSSGVITVNVPKKKSGELIDNKNLVQKFNSMVSELDEDRFNELNFQPVKYVDKKGETRPTISMDLKTFTWFTTSYDHNLRMDVVNFAFEKLEKEKDLAVIEAKKPKIYPDGRMSVRRCISEAWDDTEIGVPNENDIWNSLIWKGFATTKAKVTTTRVIPEEMEGFIGAMKNRGFATYTPSVIKKVWREFEEAIQPVVSEYDRLKEEFSQISKYYEKKLLEAKKG
jgi:hypothetical protein